MGGGAPVSDNVIHRLAMNDPTPWWRKPNLRSLYVLLFPCVIGIEMTSGFDSQIINAVQIVPAWKECKCFFFARTSYYLNVGHAAAGTGTDMSLSLLRLWPSHRRVPGHSGLVSPSWLLHRSSFHSIHQRQLWPPVVHHVRLHPDDHRVRAPGFRHQRCVSYNK